MQTLGTSLSLIQGSTPTGRGWAVSKIASLSPQPTSGMCLVSSLGPPA